MSRLINMGVSTLLSGGVISGGSVTGYISNAARKGLNMGLSELQDGGVKYFSKDREILKRAAIQSSFQLAYGILRSYPRYIKYWEQKERDKHLQTNSQSSLANKGGQYSQLIKEQQAIAESKNYSDTIVGNIVKDYLEFSINEKGSYYDNKSKQVKMNSEYGLVKFIDLQPLVQVSSKNNVVLSTVQGRDHSRKEYISGGDLEISINGKITSKYPDVYPVSEVSKFLKLMQYKGVIDCDNTVLKQFSISQFIILNYTLQQSNCRNIQVYSLKCVAVEPSEAVELKIADQEVVDKAIKHTNKWLKLVKFGTEVIDPASLLKITNKWL